MPIPACTRHPGAAYNDTCLDCWRERYADLATRHEALLVENERLKAGRAKDDGDRVLGHGVRALAKFVLATSDELRKPSPNFPPGAFPTYPRHQRPPASTTPPTRKKP